MNNWDSNRPSAVYRQTPESVELASALGRVLPARIKLGVVFVSPELDANAQRSEHALLYPEEAVLIERAVPKRFFEFVAARNLARTLLSQLGVNHGAIARGHLGAPVWPEGYVGSIAHSSGMVTVAVARREDYRALGLDLEPNLPLPSDVTSYVCLPGEQEGAPASRAVFAAKEAYYKAHCTLHQRMLDFTDVRVTFASDRWEATELCPPADTIGPTTIVGSIVTTAGWLAAFCALAAR